MYELKVAIGWRNLRKTFQKHPTKQNRLMLTVFRNFLGLITSQAQSHHHTSYVFSKGRVC